MRIYAYILSAVLALGGLFGEKNPHKLEYKNAKVVLLLDDYICSEDQWVYLHGYKNWISGNEETFFDSAFIAKGQHEVELEFQIPCAALAELLFSKNGSVMLDFAVEPDSCFVQKITEESPVSSTCIKAIQGELNNYIYELAKERTTYQERVKSYTQENKADSIDILRENYISHLEDILNVTDKPLVARCIFGFLKFTVGNVNLREIGHAVATRFDWYHSLKEYYDVSAIRPSSEESDKASARYREILNERRKVTPLETNIGDCLELTFENAAGEKVSTNDIGTPYIYVDFWASWCKPCRKEIPNIKQAADKYGNDLTVYAVSLDRKRDAWQKAIEEDSTQAFLQLIGTHKNGEPTKLLRQLNIRTIPANFLLDRERRIVAKDLREEQLMQVLDSIAGNTN